MKILRASILCCAMTALLLQTGCASYTTIAQAESGTAKVFSGTRLDIKAIEGARLPTKEFKSRPPRHPLLDLPLSFAADIVLFPLTSSAVIFEAFLQ